MDDDGLSIRRAAEGDLAQIVRLLAEDELGRGREDPREPLAQAYRDAFAAIDRDPNQLLLVAVRDDRVVATLQLTFLPGLSRMGAWRGQIEAVRVAAEERGRGVGRRLFERAIAECRNRGCRLVQLTSDRTRTEAHRFYEALGFEPSHIGFKLALADRPGRPGSGA